MTLLLLFAFFGALALAAVLRGADSVDTIDSVEWQRRREWPG